ncbi:hypothetical protein EXE10_18235 [Acinetobacter sp. WCHAc060033]|uniref:Ltp family lipoprotein n=1 Tax=Acinetobacter sp. WCHAc060033 TaxID=2518624 RepID=UPI001023C9A5|nr:Ltp family lipoprotein [Acinetobacter sp. WCHAc060033]RZG78359.1 hypothetical protein EXE10_18235 [Acinetobacter sp. WCHAc060033]
MDFINGLFAFLSLIFFVCLIIALIKPGIFKIQTRPKAFFIFTAAIIVSLIVFGVTMSDETRARIDAENKAAQQKQAAEKEQARIEAENKVKEQARIDNEKQAEEKKQAEELVSNQTVKIEPPVIDTPPAEQKNIESTPSLTRPQLNAVRSANQYLSVAGFSRKGLIDQLSSEYGDGYSKADATAAVDSLSIDWNEQAVRSANQYLSISGFSCNGLIEQLSADAGDKYTKKQASYGAQQAGACS